jgi:ABC-type phosphate transport system substrate-binding protein
MAVMSKPSLRTALAAVLASAALHCSATEMAVIVSAKSVVSMLRPEQAADIFLGHAGSFPEGGQATALDQPVGSPLRDEFYSRLTGKSPALMKSHWTKMIFTGRGHPPRELANSIAIRRLVAENPGMIGYIDKAALDTSVKAVLVLR